MQKRLDLEIESMNKLNFKENRGDFAHRGFFEEI